MRHAMTAALAASMLLGGAAAQAAVITGSSGGTFSNLTSCDNSGSSQNCRIVTTGNGSNTQVQWGSTNNANFTNPSTLTSVDRAINAVTDANDVQIAQLTWFNSATDFDSDLSQFGVNWLLTVSFTAPSVVSDSESFTLSITNPVNPTADRAAGFTLGDLAGLTFNLSGVTVSDLKYSVVNSTFANNTWTNAEGSTASLYITADFKANTAVPEPVSLALLGTAMLGLGVARRRRA